MAMILQSLSADFEIVTGCDLDELCRMHFPNTIYLASTPFTPPEISVAKLAKI